MPDRPSAISSSSLVRLLHLASPALPVGAFSYSEGLESASESGVVVDEESARRWIGDALAATIEGSEIPLVQRLLRSFTSNAIDRAELWNEYSLASRETAELRAASVQMGYSLRRWLRDVELVAPDHPAMEWDEMSFTAAFALSASLLSLDEDEAAIAFTWSWLENVALAAMKIVPLGQAAGQRILLEIGAAIPDVVRRASALGDDDLRNFAPAQAIASSRHETQYTRLYRS